MNQQLLIQPREKNGFVANRKRLTMAGAKHQDEKTCKQLSIP